MRIKDFFTVPKNGKITEKQFLRVLTTSVCGILLCTACLVSTTWALFKVDISSYDNTIQVGVFDTSVSVIPKNGAQELNQYETNTYLLPCGEYSVRISSAPKSTAPGYCIVDLDGDRYETIAIYPQNSGEGKSSQVTFNVTVQEPIQPEGTEPEGTGQTGRQKKVAAVLKITLVWGEPDAAEDLLGTEENKTIFGEAEKADIQMNPEYTPPATDSTQPTEEPTEPPTEATEPEPTEPETTEPDDEVSTEPSEEPTDPTEPDKETPTEPEATEDPEPTQESTEITDQT